MGIDRLCMFLTDSPNIKVYSIILHTLIRHMNELPFIFPRRRLCVSQDLETKTKKPKTKHLSCSDWIACTFRKIYFLDGNNLFFYILKLRYC